MLAYVFWHVPQPGQERDRYERLLRRFHEALAQDRPPGFVASTSYRLARIPWLPDQPAGYEDWYLMTGSAALDRLNEAAVSARRRLPHDAVAAVAGTGAGGLYRMRMGDPGEHSHRVAAWFSKPDGDSYHTFYASLAPVVHGIAGNLWIRQMVLGPTPEFCMHGTTVPDLPGIDILQVALEPVWQDDPIPPAQPA